MKKTFLIMAFAVFFIPMTVLSVPIVDKLKEDRQLTDKNVGKTDSTTVVNFDGHNSISIDFYKKSDDVAVKIYLNDKLIYTDFDCVDKGTTLNYKITDENSDNDFYILVEVDGKAEVMEPIEIYQ